MGIVDIIVTDLKCPIHGAYTAQCVFNTLCFSDFADVPEYDRL